jgi:hypothetical protein
VPHHKGHKVHKGVKSLDCSRFSFVTVVSFVFEKGFPLITGDPKFFFRHYEPLFVAAKQSPETMGLLLEDSQ